MSAVASNNSDSLSTASRALTVDGLAAFSRSSSLGALSDLDRAESGCEVGPMLVREVEAGDLANVEESPEMLGELVARLGATGGGGRSGG